MQKVNASPTVIVLGENGDPTKKRIAAALLKLHKTNPFAGPDEGSIMSGRKRPGAPSGPRRRAPKKRRD